MKLPKFLNAFRKNDNHSEKPQQVNDEISKTRNEVLQIIKEKNFQWDNFNKVISHVESILVWILSNEVRLEGLKVDIQKANIGVALALPWFLSEMYLEKRVHSRDPELDEIGNKNLVLRVSTDSYRRHLVLQVLDEILNSSEQDFWDKTYKIWTLEINSYQDLQEKRGELIALRNKWQEYKIPWFQQAVEYAAKHQMNTNFYE